MQPQQLFIVVITLNLIGAASMLAVIGVVLGLSWRQRLNRLLALFVSIHLLWTLAAFSGRMLLSFNAINNSTTSDQSVFNIVYVVVAALIGNGAFLFAFVTEYIGQYQDKRMHQLRWLALIITAINILALYFNTPLYISRY